MALNIPFILNTAIFFKFTSGVWETKGKERRQVKKKS